MRVLVVPTRWERRAVLKSLAGAMPQPGWDLPVWSVGDLVVVEPGMGPAATRALLPHLEARMPDEIWLYGCCGGLAPDLRVGDLVLADTTVMSEAGTDSGEPISHPPARPLLAQMQRIAVQLGARLIVGPVLSSDHLLTSAHQKRAASGRGAVAVEIEAGPLAGWAAARGVPFVHLRVVLDPLNAGLPAGSLTAVAGEAIPGRSLFVHAMRHPRQALAVWRLIRQGHRVGRVLADLMSALRAAGGPLSA